MKELWKKAGIILGHVICILIILFCITYSQNIFGKENAGQSMEVQGDIATEPLLPTSTPKSTETPTPTNTPMPTETLAPTNTPMPTETVAPTNTPMPTPQPTQAPPVTDVTDREAVKQWVLHNIEVNAYSELDNTKYSWWFRRMTNQVPSGSGEQFDISKYQGYYRDETAEDVDKVIYMTIDCGYGSANTPAMLDIFKKHDVKVMFFVTKYFIDSSPEYVRRMVEEGHMVGNHSVTHPDLTKLTDEEIYKEIIGSEEAFFEVTGKQMDLYFRPPEGAYSKRTMQITEDLGYKTIFWSIAYNDYDKNNQPGKAYVIDHFNAHHHNGAIPLMHNDSQSNLEAMDEVLTFLKEQGYRFGTLDELK